MQHFWSPSTRGFYTADVHGRNIPADAVELSPRKYANLMAAHSAGAEIVATSKGPVAKLQSPPREHFLALAVSRVKREASRRILAIATMEQQSNDNAAIALTALARAPLTGPALAAVQRRSRIDAIRAVSNVVEAELDNLTAAELAAFSAARSPHWPQL